MRSEDIIDFMLKDGGQFTVEGHYSIYSKRVYASGKTYSDALQAWWERYNERINDWDYQMIENRKPLTHLGQF